MGKDLQEFFALLCKSKKCNIILLLMSLNSASPTPAVQVVSPGSPSPWNTYDYNMHIHRYRQFPFCIYYQGVQEKYNASHW